MKQPRKRPLVLTTTRNAPPPPTATTKKLQKLLDEKKRVKKGKSMTKAKASITAPISYPLQNKTASIVNSSSIISAKPPLISTNTRTSKTHSAVNALANRGGLAGLPGAKKRKNGSSASSSASYKKPKLPSKRGKQSYKPLKSTFVKSYSNQDTTLSSLTAERTVATKATTSDVQRYTEAPTRTNHQSMSTTSNRTTLAFEPESGSTITADEVTNKPQAKAPQPQSTEVEIYSIKDPDATSPIKDASSPTNTEEQLLPTQPPMNFALKLSKPKSNIRRVVSLSNRVSAPLPSDEAVQELSALPLLAPPSRAAAVGTASATATTTLVTGLTKHPKRLPVNHSSKNNPLPPQSSSQQVPSKTSTLTVPSTSNRQRHNNNNNNNSNHHNDNFVRLNLKNSAGACRGARNKKSFRKYKQWSKNQQNFPAYSKQGFSSQTNNDNDNDDAGVDPSSQIGPSTKATSSYSGGSTGQSYTSRMTGLDPLDDYLDGAFRANNNNNNNNNKTKQKKQTNLGTQDSNESAWNKRKDGMEEAPQCARHQRPCKLLVVKKNTKGNKGKKFYCCSMPRGEQCDHFQWAEDTLEAARRTMEKNTSHSSFVARQVKAHIDRFRNLTVPELREEASKRKLNKTGKKAEIILRLAMWAREEILKACPHPEESKEKQEDAQQGDEAGNLREQIENDSDSDDTDDLSEASEELEFFGAPSNADDPDEELESSEDTEEEGTTIDLSAIGWNGDVKEDVLASALQTIFGHSTFRDGQEWAVRRCLAGEKSLLVAPTGFGKSLCYSLPAALMDGVCVVVSPLISLIQDQLRSLPPRIPAATLSGSLSASATAAILDDVVRKRIKILFVSPERLTSASFRRLFNWTWNAETQQKERKFPEISLLCIDEAHCVSQWAHNFRPCFLRFKNLLAKMMPKSTLAVTATAGPKVIADITRTLGIEGSSPNENEGVLIIDKARDNIDVGCEYVDSHETRIQKIVEILTPANKASSKKNEHAGALAQGSVIIYVWRQRDTEVVAENLAAAGVEGGVVIYHGGMDSSARSRSQSKFMRGKARICVATVAFGMGIDKRDIVGILHLYLSSSPEHYIQEIGRAGRDGRMALAMAFPTVEEVPIRHSLVHSNFISKSQVKSLLYSIKDIVKAEMEGIEGQGRHIALPIEQVVMRCDCKAETIETLLSLLEQSGGAESFLHVEGYNYDRAMVALKKRSLKSLAEREQIAGCIQKVGVCCETPLGETAETSSDKTQSFKPFQQQFIAYSRGSYGFSVAACANVLGPSAEPRHAFAALRRLQSAGELEFALDTTNNGRVFHVTLSERGFAFFSDPSFDEAVAGVVDDLHESFSSSILSGASKVLDIHYVMNSIATADEGGEHAAASDSKDRFQSLMSRYFESGFNSDSEASYQEILPTNFFHASKREVENDFVALARDLPVLMKQVPESEQVPTFGGSSFGDYTAVTTAKFLHGLDTPRAPAKMFRSHPMFGKWKEVEFSTLMASVSSLLQLSG